MNIVSITKNRKNNSVVEELRDCVLRHFDHDFRFISMNSIRWLLEERPGRKKTCPGIITKFYYIQTKHQNPILVYFQAVSQELATVALVIPRLEKLPADMSG